MGVLSKGKPISCLATESWRSHRPEVEEVRVMARTKARVPFDGQVHDGIRVGLRQANEPWTRVELEDGSEIRLKTVITDVVRIPDKYDSEGAPIYVIKSANIATVECAEHLHKDAQESTDGVQ